ncbi:hypothetical protein PsYK624_151780 [Phanerochaete sordida]|uniref:Uncharacterized protein n=1 Tax=Phanerochaete sordida TaxID=48140 RepID=A0A9P3GSV8_9APHY|nr:hypothetical protein PsYK624_151780 [Phanerochaete sordida]
MAAADGAARARSGGPLSGRRDRAAKTGACAEARVGATTCASEAAACKALPAGHHDARPPSTSAARRALFAGRRNPSSELRLRAAPCVSCGGGAASEVFCVVDAGAGGVWAHTRGARQGDERPPQTRRGHWRLDSTARGALWSRDGEIRGRNPGRAGRGSRRACRAAAAAQCRAPRSEAGAAPESVGDAWGGRSSGALRDDESGARHDDEDAPRDAKAARAPRMCEGAPWPSAMCAACGATPWPALQERRARAVLDECRG